MPISMPLSCICSTTSTAAWAGVVVPDPLETIQRISFCCPRVVFAGMHSSQAPRVGSSPSGGAGCGDNVVHTQSRTGS